MGVAVGPQVRAVEHRRVDLRAAQRIDPVPDPRHVAVHVRAGAGRVRRVAMACDPVEFDERPLGVVVVPWAGLHRHDAGRRDVRDVEPPDEQLRQRRQHRARRTCGGVVAQQRDADRLVVVPAGVRADDIFRDAAVPAFEDLTVLVDQEVVRDVAVAPGVRVVRVDAAHDPRRLASRVAVGRIGVMDERHLELGRDARARQVQVARVRAPLRSRDDRRLDRPRLCGLARRCGAHREEPADVVERAHENVLRLGVSQGVDEVDPDVVDRRDRAGNGHLDFNVVGRPDPQRLGRHAIGLVLRLDAHRAVVVRAELFPGAPTVDRVCPRDECDPGLRVRGVDERNPDHVRAPGHPDRQRLAPARLNL